MNETSSIDLRKASSGFVIPGDFVGGIPYGTGHINDTFQLTFDQAGTPLHYTLQRLNTNIFRDPDGLMENVQRVTSHAHANLRAAGAPDASRRALRLLPTRDGGVLHRDDEGNAWRCYYFIEKCSTYDIVDSPRKAFEAARAFGRFLGLLADMPGKRLNETIPDFHHTPKRYAALHEAIAKDIKGRAAGVRAEIDYALSLESEAGRLVSLMQSGDLPERATHNDTKINNVLLDDATGEGICVIDLDTLMPGSSLYDFGDMVRSATLNIAEDSTDYRQATCRRDIFEALARGFLEAGGDFLNATERANMTFGGMLMTLECGVRFLTDYLSGDVYFKIRRPEHNLDRCRTQFGLVRSILEQHDELQGFVEAQ